MNVTTHKVIGQECIRQSISFEFNDINLIGKGVGVEILLLNLKPLRHSGGNRFLVVGKGLQLKPYIIW